MNNANEPFRQVADEIANLKDCDGDYIFEAEILAERSIAAHERELAEKDKEIAFLRAILGDVVSYLDENLCEVSACPCCEFNGYCEDRKIRPLAEKVRNAIK